MLSRGHVGVQLLKVSSSVSSAWPDCPAVRTGRVQLEARADELCGLGRPVAPDGGQVLSKGPEDIRGAGRQDRLQSGLGERRAAVWQSQH